MFGELGLLPPLFGGDGGEDGPPWMVEVRRLGLVSSVSMRDGGGGSGARREARQRKHSPVPKYLGAGCGWSDR